jgi:DNA-binding MarR family transcriptional regulator
VTPSPRRNESAGEPGDRVHDLVVSYLNQFAWADVAALEANLALHETANALQRALARFIQPYGFALGPPRYLVVRAVFLAEAGRLSLSEIAKRIGVTTTNVTNLIDGLERDGWVERQANPADRRMTYVQLTELGKERCGQLIPATARLTSDLFDVLTGDEKQQLIAILAKLRTVAEERE